MYTLNNKEHIRTEHFDKVNWLPIDQIFKLCLSTSIFKFFSEMYLQQMNEIYKTTNQNNTVTRNSSLKLFQPLRTKALSQKCLSYLGPFIWNGFPDDAKLSNNVTMFKLKVQKELLINIIKRKRLRYLCILWINYHHHHLILFMELYTNRNKAHIILPCF